MTGIAMHDTPPAPRLAGHMRVPPRGRRRRRLEGTRPGTPPGTVVGPSPPAPAPVRVTVMTYDAAAAEEHVARDAEEAIGLVRPGTVTWIDVEGLGNPAIVARLGERFGLHPLALEDAVTVPQRPKVERYDAYFFVVLRVVHGGAEVEDEQVSIFFGADWVLSVQERPEGGVFSAVRDAVRHGRSRVRAARADYLAYLLVDAVVDGYFPVLDVLADRVEALEDAAVAHPTEATLVAIQHLRHDVLLLRRAVWPVREEIGVLQRDESTLVAGETKVFLRDAYDHAVQALEIVESLREGVASLMEVYLSAQNQRLNQVMKVLTVIATLFIPLTFIASIYGMNFEFMPELRWRYGYFWALGLMGLCAAAMAAYFKRKEWW
jgi:magnesium transporter